MIKTFVEDYFPKHVDIFLDLFCGGATVGVNANANEVWFNDVISPLIQMYRFLSINPLDTTIRYIDEKIEEWGLTQEKDGESNYYAFREAYNTTPVELRHPLDLFVLMAYSFNNQIRFAEIQHTVRGEQEQFQRCNAEKLGGVRKGNPKEKL